MKTLTSLFAAALVAMPTLGGTAVAMYMDASPNPVAVGSPYQVSASAGSGWQIDIYRDGWPYAVGSGWDSVSVTETASSPGSIGYSAQANYEDSVYDWAECTVDIYQPNQAPYVYSLSADRTYLYVGESTTIRIRGMDADGNLRYINLDRINGSGNTYGHWYGAGSSFSADVVANNGAWDIGSNQSDYTRALTMTFPSAGTFRFRGALNDGSGWYLNAPGSDLYITVGHSPTGSIEILNESGVVITPNGGNFARVSLNRQFYVRVNGFDVDGNLAALYARVNRHDDTNLATVSAPASGSAASYTFGPYTADQLSDWEVWGHVQDSTSDPNGWQWGGSGWFNIELPNIIVENDAPTVSMSINDVGVGGGQSAGFSISNGSTLSISTLAGDVNSNFQRTRVWVNVNGGSWQEIRNVTDTSDSFSYTLSAIGAYEFHCRSLDALGLESGTAVVNVTSNNRAPTANAQSASTPEDTAVGITLSGSDPDGQALNYVIAAGPSHGTLTGSGASRTYTPHINYSGADSFTFYVGDGSVNSGTAAVSLTVEAINDAPTISDIANRSTPEDTSTGAVGFTIGDVDTSVSSLGVSASSSNQTLVPNGNISLSSSGTNRTLTIMPTANQHGSATITVTVNDGSLTANDSFVLTVDAVNDAPTISDIGNQSINEDASTAAIPFTVGDIDTATPSLVISGTSSNQALVPNSNISFSGSGANRTVTVNPADDQFGSATITVTVTDDGSLTASDSFVLTVNAVNDPPAISITAPQDGSSFEDGEPVIFEALASDPEDGVLSSAITWTSSLDGALGPGPSITTSALSMGVHVVTASVVDAAGQPATDTISVTVSPPPPPDLITTGLVVRLESDSGITLQSGATVGTWSDQSGQGNHLFAAGNPQLANGVTPTGEPAIVFDGNEDRLERIHASAALSGLPAGNANRTFFLVARIHNVTSWAGAAYGAALDNRAFGIVARTPSGTMALTGYGTGNDLVTDVPYVGAGWIIATARLENGTAALFNDGVQVAQWAHDYNTGDAKLVVGAEITNYGYASADVAAVLVYNRALDASELTVVDAYLRAKYLEGAANNPPDVTITAPASGSTVAEGSSVTLTGAAADIEDGSLNSSIVWSSNRDGSLGAGASIVASTLSVGVHTITASVVDSGGRTATDTILLTVVAPGGTSLITSGLVLRLESDLGVTVQSGATVSAWMDQSPQGNHLGASGNPQFANGVTPTGRPAIAFDGSGDKVERIHASAPLNGLPAGNANRTLFVIARIHSVTSWAGVAYGTALDNRAFGIVARTPSGTMALTGYGNENDLVTNTPFVGAGWVVGVARLQNGAASLYHNGAQVAQWTHTYNTGGAKLVVGAEITDYGYATADVAAVLIYDRALNASEIASVEAYLREKYLDGVVNNAPDVTINSPSHGSSVAEGVSITLTGAAVDAEDGDLSGGIAWSSSLDGALGSGGSVSVSSLSAGTHTITASVADSGGQTAADSIVLTIVPPGGTQLVTAGLVLRLESDAGVTLQSGTTVAGWSDQSPQANHVTASGDPQLSAAVTPTGRPAIVFDGNGDKLERIHSNAALNGLPAGNANRTFVLVSRMNSVTSWSGAAYGTADENRAFGIVARSPSGTMALTGYGSGNDLVTNLPFVGAGWVINVARLENGTATLSRDGVQVAQWTHTYNTGYAKLVIGAEITYYGYATADVAAVLMYDRALNTAELASVNGYLRDKYIEQTVVNQAPDGAIDAPVGDITIAVGQSVSFTGSGSDPDGHTPLTYLWNFGSGSGIANSTAEDPGARQFNNPGTFVVTLTVTDAQGSADPTPATRTVTVNANQTPNGVIDVPSGNITINVGQSVTFIGTGSDTDGHTPLAYLWSFGSGSGLANSTAEDPGARQFNQAGVFAVTFTVTDALGAADPSPATLVVTVNAPPTISDVGNQTVNLNTSTGALAFSIGDDLTSPGSIALSGSSSNPAVIPVGNIVFGGAGASRNVTVTPAANQSGAATITLTATDSNGLSVSDTFVVTVNAPPTISDIANQNIYTNNGVPQALTIGDDLTAPGSLTLSASSSNPGLVPHGAITFGGSGASRTVTVTSSQVAAVTITVTVTDAGGLTASDSFVATILSESGDADGDQMPDTWELQYGLNPNDPGDAGLEGESAGQQDGLTNLMEFLLGTDPRTKNTTGEGPGASNLNVHRPTKTP